MRRVLILLGLCLILFAQDTEYISVPGGFMTGQDYLGLNAQSRAAYAAGFFNGMTVAGIIVREGKSLGAMWLKDCSKGMTDTQMAEIIRKEIQDRPSEWHHGLNQLSATAMLNACKEYQISQPAGKN